MMMGNNDDQQAYGAGASHPERAYVLGGRIMLSAIIILFAVVILIIVLHLYARWYLLRARRRHFLRRRQGRRSRRTNLVFYVDPIVSATRGLDASVLKTLPVFRYGPDTHPIECAVCLSEFEEGESGRTLPKCMHSFHIECIDMWFHSHSTCPLCRSPVEPFTQPAKPDDVALTVSEPGPSSGRPCDGGRNDEAVEGEAPASSTSTFKKPAAIEVPRRDASASEDERSRSDSPASRSFKSPVSRMLSFTRMLNRERRANVSSPSSPSCCGGSSSTEVDVERGSGGGLRE